MGDAGCDPLDDLSHNVCQIWPPGNNGHPLPESASQAPPQHCLETKNLGLPISGSPSRLVRPEAEGSCIEVESAHRRLQEIEERLAIKTLRGQCERFQFLLLSITHHNCNVHCY